MPRDLPSAVFDFLNDDPNQPTTAPAGTFQGGLRPSPSWPPAGEIAELNTRWLNPGMELEAGTGFGGQAGPSSTIQRQFLMGGAPNFMFNMGEPGQPTLPDLSGLGDRGGGPNLIAQGLSALSKLSKTFSSGAPTPFSDFNTNLKLGGALFDPAADPMGRFNVNNTLPADWPADAANRLNLGVDPKLNVGNVFDPSTTLSAGGPGSQLFGNAPPVLDAAKFNLNGPGTDWPTDAASRYSVNNTNAGAGVSYGPAYAAALATLLAYVQGGPKAAYQTAFTSGIPAAATMAGTAAAGAGAGALAGGVVALPNILGPLLKGPLGHDSPSFPNNFITIPGQPNAAVDPTSGAILWYKGNGKYAWSDQTQGLTPASKQQLEDWYGPNLWRLGVPYATRSAGGGEVGSDVGVSSLITPSIPTPWYNAGNTSPGYSAGGDSPSSTSLSDTMAQAQDWVSEGR